MGVEGGKNFVGKLVQLIVAIAVIVVSAIAFMTKRESKSCSIILVSAMTAGYFFVRLLNSAPGTWTYAMPLMVVAAAYLNSRLIIISSSVIFATNILRLLIELNAGGEVLQRNVVAVLVMALSGYALIMVTRTLDQFFKENMEEIKEAALLQVENGKKMILVADNISKQFDEAMTMLNELDEAVSVSHNSIQDIADSTESTAEAIQKQASMCVEIQGNTDNVESGIKAMIDASRQTDKTVKQGADVVEELKEQANNVAEESIKKILDSTTVISENITHLSATGEEVAASSTEGIRMADITVENMAKCKKVLENIYMLADDLKNSAEDEEQ